MDPKYLQTEGTYQLIVCPLSFFTVVFLEEIEEMSNKD